MQNSDRKEAGKVETVNVEGAPQIRLSGECDVSTVSAVQEHLVALMESGRTRLIFNLEGATFLDSSILRVFLSAHRHVAASGGEIVLLCRPGFVRRLLHMLEIDRLVKVWTPEEWRDRVSAIH